MYSWFARLPRVIRLLIVLLLYIAVYAGHVAIVNLYIHRFSEQVDTKEVVVTVRDMPIHSVITENDIAVKRIRLASLVHEVITDPAEVIGKETQTSMSTNEQFSPLKINTVIKNEGEMILEIPTDWVLSFPKSLRRMDKVAFLPVRKVDEVRSSDLSRSDQLEHASDVNADQALAQAQAEQQHNAYLKEAENILNGITVAYFKDNSANEVTDSINKESNESTPRLRATNIGARLEVAMTPQQWELLDHLRQYNYRFVISYE
ncbi:SAF domain-containing protein [Paenibacillus marinisediminis]